MLARNGTRGSIIIKDFSIEVGLSSEYRSIVSAVATRHESWPIEAGSRSVELDAFLQIRL